jgi:hypothetical protein
MTTRNEITKKPCEASEMNSYEQMVHPVVDGLHLACEPIFIQIDSCWIIFKYLVVN